MLKSAILRRWSSPGRMVLPSGVRAEWCRTVFNAPSHHWKPHQKKGKQERQETAEDTRNPNWETVIGLEVHAQINSKSKLFSGAATKFNEPPNSQVSFFDMATPGTLPVLNRYCVECAARTSLALQCQLNMESWFDRKHYFYADLPCGYQITQQRRPIATGGYIDFVHLPTRRWSISDPIEPCRRRARIHQIQLEQDSGKSIHDVYDNKSLIDLNRAGMPLMEIVFEPDLRHASEAAALVRELIDILTALNVCSGRMQEGALRVDANVSVRLRGLTSLGVRTEIKNIFSVRAIEKAIEHESQRQIDVLEKGGTVENHTRTWDAETNATLQLRDKEVLQDYRFMPEPNLPPLRLLCDGSLPVLHRGMVNVAPLKESIPQLPLIDKMRLACKYNIPYSVVLQLTEQDLISYFLRVMNDTPVDHSHTVVKIILKDVIRTMEETETVADDCPLDAKRVAEIAKLLHSEEISEPTASLLLNRCGKDTNCQPEQVVYAEGLRQITDRQQLLVLIKQAMEKHPKNVRQFTRGKVSAINRLLGEVRELSNNRANMAMVDRLYEELFQNLRQQQKETSDGGVKNR